MSSTTTTTTTTTTITTNQFSQPISMTSKALFNNKYGEIFKIEDGTIKGYNIKCTNLLEKIVIENNKVCFFSYKLNKIKYEITGFKIQNSKYIFKCFRKTDRKTIPLEFDRIQYNNFREMIYITTGFEILELKFD